MIVLGMLALLFLVMTVAFTFPGMRGGLLHSGGAPLPFLFAATGPGLEAMLRRVARRFRRWNARKAWPVFSASLVAIVAMVTTLVLWHAGALTADWNERDWAYAEIGDLLAQQGETETVVMVGNAPGLTWHTGQPSIAVPSKPLDTILAAVDRYDARYLVLDSTRPRKTNELYVGTATHPRLALRRTTEHWQVYEVEL
jgi:hypothetical protein